MHNTDRRRVWIALLTRIPLYNPTMSPIAPAMPSITVPMVAHALYVKSTISAVGGYLNQNPVARTLSHPRARKVKQTVTVSQDITRSVTTALA